MVGGGGRFVLLLVLGLCGFCWVEGSLDRSDAVIGASHRKWKLKEFDTIGEKLKDRTFIEN